ncbi:hypothetical protein BLNAU_20771 [Blattamonas nauphoetae]|uniref:Uncharacterized protein n=1 Tax=Blattamonas nauphoetae TaxID=2049346 RepID=A0ABQ9WXT2_9EUKA|nr:hypothetical protein BLNAU_20771 [Blattamonas nauphoetae]
MTGLNTKKPSSTDSPCPDCSPFVNWSEEHLESESEKAVIFQALVTNLQLQPAIDDSLEAKAVNFLKSVDPLTQSSAHAFLSSLTSNSDDSLTDFIKSMIVLISSTSQAITTAAMKMLDSVFWKYSTQVRLDLVRADLISQLVIALNPQSISFAEAEDTHICLLSIINRTFWLITPSSLAELGIQDENKQQAVHETIVKQVVVPSEKYIRHLCVNRFSIVDGDQSQLFLDLLTNRLKISPHYQPTMDFVLHMPIVLTIPSCLAFFENDYTMWRFLNRMNNTQEDWNRTRGKTRHMKKKVHQILRMEGIEDVIEERLRNDKKEYNGRWTVAYSIQWNNMQGMNAPQRP